MAAFRRRGYGPPEEGPFVGAQVLRIRNLVVQYPAMDRPALSGFELDVAAGDTVAIVGESGSGKSTAVLAALRLLGDEVALSAEALDFEGRDLRTMPAAELRTIRARRIGMVFQDPTASWNPVRRLSAQLLDGTRAAGLDHDEGRRRLVELMQRVGIDRPERRLDSFPHQFSGGMLQRAMIAGALSTRPSLLVADEPTSALDTTVQAELLSLIDELRAQSGFSLVFISHDLGVVAQMADRCVLLYAGRIVEQGPTADIFRAPAHPYTVGLLAAIPRFDHPRKEPLAAPAPGEIATSGCVYAPRCPLAEQQCRDVDPPMRSHLGRRVACHRAEDVPDLLRHAA